MLEHIIEFGIRLHQASLEAQVESSVILVHLVVFGRVFLPNRFCVGEVESTRMLLVEGLHIGNELYSLVVVLDLVIPNKRSALFNDSGDLDGIDEVIGYVGHNLCEYDLVDAREALGVSYIGYLVVAETHCELCFFLDTTGYLIELVVLIGVRPIGHKIVAVGLVRHRYEKVKTFEKLHSHASCRSGEKDMYCQTVNARFVLEVSCALVCHLPKGIFCSVGYEVLINAVEVIIKTCRKNTTKDVARYCCFDTAECRHNCQVELCRRSRCLGLCHDLRTSGLCVEEFSVFFDLLSHSRSRADLHFIHPHGYEVGSEFLAIELCIHQPIVIGVIDSERIIDEQVRGSVIVDQLLHGKGIVACESYDGYSVDGDLIELVLELSILVVPKNDTTKIEFGQGCSKSAI